MKLLIAHRGLINGPSKELENRPDQILTAIDQGFDCEVDVRYIDGKWFLGHDNPDYEIPFEFLKKPELWIHAKNLDALYMLGNTYTNYFWHQGDDFTLTNFGWIWTYPGNPLTKNSVCVMPEWNDPEFKNLNTNCYGICSDYVERIRYNLQLPKI